jgi:hypothetical protein
MTALAIASPTLRPGFHHLARYKPSAKSWRRSPRPALAAIKPGFERDFASSLSVLLTGLLLPLDAACQSENL